MYGVTVDHTSKCILRQMDVLTCHLQHVQVKIYFDYDVSLMISNAVVFNGIEIDRKDAASVATRPLTLRKVSPSLVAYA